MTLICSRLQHLQIQRFLSIFENWKASSETLINPGGTATYKSLLTCFKFVKSYYKYQGEGDLESQDFLLIPADDLIGSCTAEELQPNNFRKVPADSDL